MKYLLILFSISVWTCSGQNLYLKISGINETENKIIDSLSWNKKHANQKTISDEVNSFKNKITQKGYIDLKFIETKKLNDSVFEYNFNLGKKVNFIHVYIGGNSELKTLQIFDSKSDTLVLPFIEIENFLNAGILKLEQKGYALSKLKLKNIQPFQNILKAELELVLDKKRGLDGIVINGYDKFPVGFKKNIRNKYKKLIFNKNNLKFVYNDFNKIRFVKQLKYPEILFTKDSTKIFVYLEKAKRNTFDGFVGFSNDENKNLIFNGYVDLELNNTLNIGEKLAFYWKSDGKNQKTFNISTELPYIFKTPLGLKAQLNIFKQDSIFQNTKTNIDLGYFLDLNARIYLGYQETESNDINNFNSKILSDSKSTFYTSSFEFQEFNIDDFLFPEKINFTFKLGAGKRNAKTQSNKQFFVAANVDFHYYLNKKNAIRLKSQNYFLKSDNYLINELTRFGGINSIRGFNENSLQANVLVSLMAEYQYLLSDGLYFHTLTDYAYFQDKTIEKSGKLFGIGFGFGLQTKNGLFNFVYANGSSDGQAIKFSNSVVHLSLKTIF